MLSQSTHNSRTLIIMERTYQVTYACDSLDPNPIVRIFNEFNEMSDWIEETVADRMDWFVQHSPWTISNDEWYEQREIEYSLIKVKEV
mgnify:CR=1 FL=1